MGIFLGNAGCVELKRTQFDEQFTSVVNDSDVNADKDRFSFKFPLGSLITGDMVEIKRTDGGGVLSFISPTGWPTNKQYRGWQVVYLRR